LATLPETQRAAKKEQVLKLQDKKEEIPWHLKNAD
jgi:hypothetical protein